MLEGNQCVGLPNLGELILELIWEPLIELPVKGLVIPAGAWRVLVEVESVLHSLACVLVPKVFNTDSGFVDGVAQAEEVAEFVNEHLDRGQPGSRHETGCSVGNCALEPVEHGAFQVNEHECHLGGFIQEILSTDHNVHGALEYESFKLSWVGSIEQVRAPWLDTGLGLGRCGWCGRNGEHGQTVSHGGVCPLFGAGNLRSLPQLLTRRLLLVTQGFRGLESGTQADE